MKLLTKDPSERLGTGPKGSDNNIESIKQHPFFKGIDWSKLNKYKPPIDSLLSIEPSNKRSFSPKSRRLDLSQLKPQETLSDKGLSFKIDLVTLMEDDERTLVFECKASCINH
jgi:hypothetical protein